MCRLTAFILVVFRKFGKLLMQLDKIFRKQIFHVLNFKF